MTNGSQQPGDTFQQKTQQLAGLFFAGIIGAILATLIGAPLPFMLGGLFGAFPLVYWASTREQRLFFPPRLRQVFVAVIGTMIGGTVSPDLVSQAPGMAVSLFGMAAFVPLSLGVGFVICRVVGGYDRTTALFAAMPGGLIEAIEMGRKKGGDVPTLVLAHFLRIVCVVVMVPLGFLLLTGEAVGSAGGQTLSTGPAALSDVVKIAALVLAGIILGRFLRMPASHLVGPMVLSAVLHGVGLVETSSPNWLLNTSQLIVGVGLATNFLGASLSLLWRVFKTTLVQVSGVGIVGVSVAWLCAMFSPVGVDALILSFAPGGVSEMGLIALSLSLSPVIVTVHHVFRIFLTISFVGLLAKWL